MTAEIGRELISCDRTASLRCTVVGPVAATAPEPEPSFRNEPSLTQTRRRTGGTAMNERCDTMLCC